MTLRSRTKRSRTRRSVLLAIAAALACAFPASADRSVAVFFRGFLASPPAGMDHLEAHLAAAFGGEPSQPFSSQVFAWTEQQEAFDFIAGFSDVGCLILVGHSFGANSAIELVTEFLAPAGIHVNLLITLDSVGANDDELPGNVDQGFNYWQVSTNLFEPQGTSNVQGSLNENVEDLYGVDPPDITHTEIDDPLFERTPAAYAALFGSQPDLYARIEDSVALFCAVFVPALGPMGIAALLSILLAAGRRSVQQTPK